MARRLFVLEYLAAGGAGADPALRAQGRAMRDALLDDLRGVEGVETTSLDGEADDDLFERLRREAVVHDAAWVVAPESAGLLLRLHDVVAGAGGCWIGCERRAIALASSKRATLERLAALGLATPLAFESRAERWVVKPDDGAGAVATRCHASRDAARSDLAARAAAGTTATLEAWVEGEPLSLSLLGHEGRVELLAVNRQRIEVDAAGAVTYRGVSVNALGSGDARRPALAAFATDVGAAVPGLRGYVGVDLVWHRERGPVAIEINPRLTCAYVGLSAALGRNLARDILAAHG